MLFGRIAFIGIMLAAVAAGVIQIRLMNATAAREIHLLVGQQQALQRQIWQQEMESARLRTPQRIADRLASAGTGLLPPDAGRTSDRPPREASVTPPDPATVLTNSDATPPAQPAQTTDLDSHTASEHTNSTAQGHHSGGPSQTGPGHSAHARRSPR